MDRYGLTTSELSLVSATLGNVSSPPLQIEQPDRSCANNVKRDGEASLVRAEASSEAQLCIETGPSLVYESE